MKTFGNITANGKVYLYPAEAPADRLWIDQKGHTNYWCSVLDDTKGSSKYPRTEGRQTLPDSSASFNWMLGSAKHSMAGRVRVEAAPSSGKVIIGQIHAVNSPNPFLMVTWWSGSVRIESRNVPLGSARTLIEKAVPLGQPFDYNVQVDEIGELGVSLDELRSTSPVSSSLKKLPFFLKAGAYVIDNKGAATEGGLVVYEAFDVFNEALRA